MNHSASNTLVRLARPPFCQACCIRSRISSICGSLVTVRKQVIELIHLSAKKFHLEPVETSILSDGLEIFLVGRVNHSPGVASSCMSYLGRKELTREISPINEKIQEIKHTNPWVEYACFNSISHVTEAT